MLDNLKSYCEKNKIDFVVSYCVTSPLDLIEADEISRKTDVRLIVQRVENSGRARETNSYYKFEEFDPTILDEKCPNFESLSYFPGKGYSVCCSSLLSNDNFKEGIITNHNLIEYISSNFYNTVTNKSFKERLPKTLDYNKPKYSSPCQLCEAIFFNR